MLAAVMYDTIVQTAARCIPQAKSATLPLRPYLSAVLVGVLRRGSALRTCAVTSIRSESCTWALFGDWHLLFKTV